MAVAYIKSHNWDKKLAEDAVYKKERKGLLMIHRNYVFYNKNVAKKWIKWTCRECDAVCRVWNDGSTVKDEKEHRGEDHPLGACKPLSDLDIRFMFMELACKERAQTEDTRHEIIYQEEREKLIADTKATVEQLADALTPFSSLVHMVLIRIL